MKSYIVGNWKMNFTVSESSIYLHKLLQRIHAFRDINVVVAPSFTALQSLSLQVDRRKIHLAAQAANPHDFGPYTGEISCAQLRGLVDYCLVGQVERRRLFHETDKYIRSTVAAALRNGLTPILCLGETDTERTFGETFAVVRDQLLGALGDIEPDDIPKIIIAYEPVWAISSTTGAHLASPDDVAVMVEYIRKTLREAYSADIADSTPVIYGGSVAPTNAGAYLAVAGVNGLLVGNSSLIADQFVSIVETAKRIKS